MAANLETEIYIDAPVEKVWSVISDLRRMPEWSPQCRRVLNRGQVQNNTMMLNINRHGKLWWPTRAKVTDFSQLQRIAFRVLDNNTEWSFTLTPDGEGTRVTERRDVPPNGTTKISQVLVAKVLGGEQDFEANLVSGMQDTLAKLKATVESSQ